MWTIHHILCSFQYHWVFLVHRPLHPPLSFNFYPSTIPPFSPLFLSPTTPKSINPFGLCHSPLLSWKFLSNLNMSKPPKSFPFYQLYEWFLLNFLSKLSKLLIIFLLITLTLLHKISFPKLALPVSTEYSKKHLQNFAGVIFTWLQKGLKVTIWFH